MWLYSTSRFFLSDLPDVPPALVPAPAKRARPSPGHALPHDEDPEERLSRHDQHITAVLSKIIVRVSPAAGGGEEIAFGEERIYEQRVLQKGRLSYSAVRLGLG